MRTIRFLFLFVLGLLTYGSSRAQFGSSVTLLSEASDGYGYPAMVVASLTNNTSLSPHTYSAAGQSYTFSSSTTAVTRLDFSYTYPFTGGTSTFTLYKVDMDSWPMNTYYVSGIAAGGAKIKIKRTGVNTYSFAISQVYL